MAILNLTQPTQGRAKSISANDAGALITALRAEPAPPITCRVCNHTSPARADAVLLCSHCAFNLDATQARVDAARQAALAAFDAAYGAYISVYDAAEPAVRAWWDKILQMRAAYKDADADALLERAWAAQGRGAPLVLAWRVWITDSKRCTELLAQARAAQDEVNTARLNAMEVL